MLGLGMDRLEADINRLLASLFHEGVLDEQFLQLHQLQDETSPTFVYDVINIYFDESDKLLHNLRLLLSDREFWEYKKIGLHLNQLVGSSSSIGARRLRNVCVAFRSAYELNNRLGCLKGLEILEYEYHYLKNMMHELFQLEQQRLLAAGVSLYGFRQPVEASLVLAGTVAGDVQPSMVSLMQNPGSEEGECAELRTDGWYEVDLGHFFKRRGDFGEIQMTLKETEKRPSEKKGLVLLGIEIRPMP